ncbi:hypothetical protein [Microbacterium phyllosphaerae]
MRDAMRIQRMQRMPLCVSAVALSAVLLTAALGCLTACAPTPVPTATPTAAFASEEEAYAAAEEVYRAYNDALNESRMMTAGADPQRFLTGLALESDLEASRYFDEHRLEVAGEGVISQFDGLYATLSTSESEVIARVCLDVSNTQVFDADGNDVTPTNRPTRLPLEVTFVQTTGILLISNESLIEGEAC